MVRIAHVLLLAVVNEVERRRLRLPAHPSRAGAVAAFIGAGVLAALASTWFQRICASQVSLDDIGAFNALLAVAGGVGVLGLGLQLVIGRMPAGTTMPASMSLGAGAVVGLLVGIGMPVSGWYAVAVGGLMGATTTATFVGISARARLLREADWLRLGWVYLAGAAARLVVVAPLLAVIGSQLTAALAATAIGEAATSLVAIVLAPDDDARERVPADLRNLVRASVALGGLWAFTVVDTVVGRLRLVDAAADGYSLATTVARSSFFMALLLTHLALPTLMRERGRSQRTRDVFTTAILAIGAVSAVVAVVVVAVPSWVADVLLGEDAAVVELSTLRLLALAWAAMSVVPLLTYAHLDRHPRLALAPTGGAVAVATAGLVVHTPDALAVVTTVVFVGCAALMGLPAVQRLAPVVRSLSWTPPANGAPALAVEADIAMVVPFYNPGVRVLVDTVRRLDDTLAGLGCTYRIVAVSDGSTDGSAEALAAHAMPLVELVTLPVNRGKGAALRAGLACTQGALVGYIDADGDVPPEQLATLARIASVSGADAVLASKVHPDSELAVRRHRSAMSIMFRVGVRVLFRLDVRDTQTGLKLYRGDLIAAIVPKLHEDGFAIDVEMLVAAGRERALSIVEAPVRIVPSNRSTVSWRGALNAGAGLGRIFWRNHVGLLYEVPITPTPSTVGG